MEHFKYQGTYTGSIKPELKEYADTIIKNANDAQTEYDLVNQWMSSIQTTDDSESEYLKNFGDTINQEIAKIAKDSQGNIRWETALGAIKNLKRKVQSDQGLNNIKENYKLYTAAEDSARKAREQGRVPLFFNSSDKKGVTYDQNGVPTFNRYGGFYEVKGQWQDGYNKNVQELGVKAQEKYRELYKKLDNNTITAEEEKELDQFVKYQMNVGKGVAETDQHMRELMSRYGNDEDAVKKHIRNTQLRQAVFSMSPNEVQMNDAVLKHRNEMMLKQLEADAKAKAEADAGAVSDTPTPLFTRGVSNILNNQGSLNAPTIPNSAFDRTTGNLSSTSSKVFSIDEKTYKSLNDEEKKKYKLHRGTSAGGGIGTSFSSTEEYLLIDPSQVSKQNHKLIEGYRSKLIRAGYPGISDNTPQNKVYEIMNNLYKTETTQMLTQFNITNPQMLEGLQKTGYVKNKEWFQANLGSSIIKVMNDPKDTKPFNVKTDASKIKEVSFQGFGSFNQKLNNIEAGSGIYNISYENEKGETKTVTAVVPSSEKDINFKQSFKVLNLMQEKLASVDYSSSNKPREALLDKNLIKPTDLGFVKNTGSLFFTPVKTIDNQSATGTSLKIKPVGVYDGVRYYLDSFYIDRSGAVQMNPHSANEPLIQRLFNNEEARTFIKNQISAIQSHFLTNRVDLELEDGFTYSENMMKQNPQFRAAAYTGTTADAAAAEVTRDNRGYNNPIIK